MPSETERWRTGDLRNTVGHPSGATGPITGGVEGHAKSEPLEGPEKEKGAGRKPFDPTLFTGGG